MLVSKCCSELIFVQSGDSGSRYYVCDKCHKACEARFVLDLGEIINGQSSVVEASG